MTPFLKAKIQDSTMLIPFSSIIFFEEMTSDNLTKIYMTGNLNICINHKYSEVEFAIQAAKESNKKNQLFEIINI